MPPLLDNLRSLDECINRIHGAFGAPGDYGYATLKGAALFELYRAQPPLRAAISELEHRTQSFSTDEGAPR